MSTEQAAPLASAAADAVDTMDIMDIMNLLPHRYPFLMVDRVVELVRGQYIKAYKNVSINEPFFQGHFPGAPVMPGVLLMEALAQVAGLLVVKTENIDTENNLFLFSGMEGVKFRRPVRPGDRVDMHCTVLRSKMRLWKTQCKAYVDGSPAAEGILTAAIIPRKEFA